MTPTATAFYKTARWAPPPLGLPSVPLWARPSRCCPAVLGTHGQLRSHAQADKPTPQSAPLRSCLSEAACHFCEPGVKVCRATVKRDAKAVPRGGWKGREQCAHTDPTGTVPQANKERFQRLREKMRLERKEKEEAAKREAAERRVKEDAELRMRRVAEEQAAHGAPLQHQFRLHPQ